MNGERVLLLSAILWNAATWVYMCNEVYQQLMVIFVVTSRICGRLSFVRTDRSVRTERKWNASVLRTERTGSGPAGPALGVGPASSLAPARLHA